MSAVKEYGDVHLLKALNERNIYSLFPSTYKQALKALEKLEVRNHRFLFKRFLLHMELAEYQSFVQTEEKTDIFGLNKMFDEYLIIQKLYLFIHLVNWNKLKGANHEVPFELAIQQKLDGENENELSEGIRLWYWLYRIYTSDDKRFYYHKLKNELEKVAEIFDRDETDIFFSALMNNLPEITRNDAEFYTESFDLHMKKINLNLLGKNEDGGISPILFNNIINISLRVGKLDWAKNFYASNKSKILGANHNEVLEICAAKIQFEEGNFEGALLKLNNCFFSLDEMKLMERTLRLKIYYELKMVRLFDDFINSYRKFLSLKKSDLAEDKIARVLSFITLANKLFHGGSKTDVSSLASRISTEKYFLEKHWLLEKIKEKKNLTKN